MLQYLHNPLAYPTCRYREIHTSAPRETAVEILTHRPFSSNVKASTCCERRQRGALHMPFAGLRHGVSLPVE